MLAHLARSEITGLATTHIHGPSKQLEVLCLGWGTLFLAVGSNSSELALGQDRNLSF
jgi:hypothetical protein